LKCSIQKKKSRQCFLHSQPKAVLTSLINDLDVAGEEMILVLDDYQFMSNQPVHAQVAFFARALSQNVSSGDRESL